MKDEAVTLTREELLALYLCWAVATEQAIPADIPVETRRHLIEETAPTAIRKLEAAITAPPGVARLHLAPYRRERLESPVPTTVHGCDDELLSLAVTISLIQASLDRHGDRDPDWHRRATQALRLSEQRRWRVWIKREDLARKERVRMENDLAMQRAEARHQLKMQRIAAANSQARLEKVALVRLLRDQLGDTMVDNLLRAASAEAQQAQAVVHRTSTTEHATT